MNVKLLRKIQRHILAEPRRFDMRFVTLNPGYLPQKEQPPCGTVCCISGWASILARPESKLTFSAKSWLANGNGGWLVDEHGHLFTGEDAAIQLNIDEAQADRLFYDYNWPLKYVRRYRNAKTPRGKARAGYDRIDHFIATKGAE